MQPAVLLVDDLPANLLALDAALEPLEIETVLASSGEEAVRITAGRDFAAVLMDVRMPGMNGLEAAEVIRRRPHGRDVPIVLVSAIDRELVHIERGYQAGALDYLLKPLDDQMVRAKVAVLVELWQSRQQSRQLERQDADRRVDQLLAWLGHELRNPLAALLTIMELRARRNPALADWEQTVLRQLGKLEALSDAIGRLESEGGFAPLPSHDPGGQPTAREGPPRVLLVDDNEDALQALADLLRDSGAEVATASTAAQALQVAVRFHPALAVVDIGLPDLDGHELGKRLKHTLGEDAPRLFALSGFGGRDDFERSRGAGFDQHFVKPADLPLLLRTLGLG